MASIFKAPGLDRLGLADLIGDHQATLYRLDQEQKRHPRVADFIVLWGMPLAVGTLSYHFGWRMTSTDPILNGVAILAGGLFGLLALIFGLQSLGAKVPDAVVKLVHETRANVSYATGLCLLLVAVLMVTEAFRSEQVPQTLGSSVIESSGPEPLGSVVTALILAGLAHLGLVLLMVLNRIRLVFANLPK